MRSDSLKHLKSYFESDLIGSHKNYVKQQYLITRGSSTLRTSWTSDKLVFERNASIRTLSPEPTPQYPIPSMRRRRRRSSNLPSYEEEEEFEPCKQTAILLEAYEEQTGDAQRNL